MTIKLLLVLLCLGTGAGAQDSDDIARDLAVLRERIAELQEALGAQRAERDATAAALARAETEVGRATRRLRDLRAQREEERSRLAALEAEREALSALLARQRERLAALLRADYTTGAQSRLRLLLSQEDPGRIGRTLAYFRYLRAARLARIEAVEENLARLAAVGAQLEASLAELQRLGESLEREQDNRIAARERRKALLARIDQRIGATRAEISDARSESERLAALLEELRQALADIPEGPGQQAFDTLRGQLAWPVAGTLEAGPGRRKGGGLHAQGALIAAPAGTEVRAVAAGRVAFADWLRGFGLLTIVDHGGGFMSLYAFNESLFKDAGDWIARGELIAVTGDSGGRERTGLYFELRKDGEPVDPRPWFRDQAP